MSGRIRTIKPELLEDEDAAALSDGAWRLWVGSWVLCDDHGACRAGARYLASTIWQDTARAEGVDALLGELVSVGKITVYEASGQRYLRVNGWRKHQRIDNSGKPRVPVCGDVAGYPDMRIMDSRELTDRFSESCGENPRLAATIRDSRDLAATRARADAQSGGEDLRPRPPTTDQHRSAGAELGGAVAVPDVEVGRSTKPKASRGTRLPEGFRPSEKTIAAFRADGWDCLAHLDEFADYWRAVPGARGVKLDWDATFRNRMRDLVANGRAKRLVVDADPLAGIPLIRIPDRDKYIPRGDAAEDGLAGAAQTLLGVDLGVTS